MPDFVSAWPKASEGYNFNKYWTKGKLSFWDKIINVTFFKEKVNDEGVADIESVMCVRCDKLIMVPGFLQKLLMKAGKTNVSLGAVQMDRAYLDSYSLHHGMKPSIRLTMQQLPESVCTQISLSIDNMSFDVDISQYTSMFIECGYSMQHVADLTQSFHVAIFSSYIEKPNPNGRVTFTGIVGNWMIKGLLPQPYRIYFTAAADGKRGISIYELVSVICSYLGVAFRFNGVPPEIKEYELTLTAQEKDELWFASNGYAVIDWLCNVIHNATSSIQAAMNGGLLPWDQLDILGCFFYNNILEINLIKTTDADELRKTAIDLNRISSATLQGGQMFVEAPWNPLLKPGTLFYMRPSFFKGRMAPRVGYKELLDKTNLYRAITIDLTFATVSDENRMKVMSVAAREKIYDAASNLLQYYNQVEDKNGNMVLEPKTLEEYVKLQRGESEKEAAETLMGLQGTRYDGGGEDAKYFPYMVGNLWAPSRAALTDVQRARVDERIAFSNDHQNDVSQGRHVVVINLSKEEAQATETIIPNPDKDSGDGGGGSGAIVGADPGNSNVPAPPQPVPLPQPTPGPAPRPVPQNNFVDPARLDTNKAVVEGEWLRIPYVGPGFRDDGLISFAHPLGYIRMQTLGIIPNATPTVMHIRRMANTATEIDVLFFLRIMACLGSYQYATKNNPADDKYHPNWLGAVLGMFPELMGVTDPPTTDNSGDIYPRYPGTGNTIASNKPGSQYYVPKITGGEALKKFTQNYDSYFKACAALFSRWSPNHTYTLQLKEIIEGNKSNQPWVLGL